MRKMYIGSHKVERLASGSYHCRISTGKGPDGKYHNQSITAPTLDELREIVERMEHGSATERVTVGEAMNTYIATCEMAGHSPATIMGYHQIARNSISIIRNTDIRLLTVPMIQKQINDYSQNHSPKSVANSYGLLHKVLNVYRPDLQLNGIVLPKNKKTANGDAGLVIPDDDMIRSLLALLSQDDIEMFKAVLLAATLGLRRSEICALTWADLNLTFRCYTVDKAVVRGDDHLYHTKDPKSSAGTRTNPLPRAVVEALQGLSDAPEKKVVNLSPDAITRRWERLAKAQSIPGRFHDLRHYHASVLVALGVPEAYAMRDMGHSTPGLYKRVYAHMMPEAKQQMYSALDRQTDSILQQPLQQKAENR